MLIPGTVCRARDGWTPQGQGRIYTDYLWDVGVSHVVDYYLHREVLALAALYRSSRKPSAPLQSIGRYLDGEEEREGTYR